MDKVIITAALTGPRPTKGMNSAVHYTPEEIAASAGEWYESGVAIAPNHVRDRPPANRIQRSAFFNKL